MSNIRYYTSYCFNACDLYDTFNLKQLKIRRDTVTKKYGVHSKQDFCKQVLLYCFYLILLDIIENNVTFVLPTGSRESEIQVKSYTGDELKKMIANGKFAGIDFYESDFTGYQLTYRYKSSTGFKTKPIYINERHKQRFYELINSGKKYY